MGLLRSECASSIDALSPANSRQATRFSGRLGNIRPASCFSVRHDSIMTELSRVPAVFDLPWRGPHACVRQHVRFAQHRGVVVLNPESRTHHT